MTRGAFCFVQGSAVVGGPGKVGQNQEQSYRDRDDQEHQLRHLHDCNSFQTLCLWPPAWTHPNAADEPQRRNENFLTVMQFLWKRARWSVITITPRRDRDWKTSW